MAMATGTGWPARKERTMMSMASGNCPANFSRRRFRMTMRAMKGKAVATTIAPPRASSVSRPAMVMAVKAAAATPIRIGTSRAGFRVIPDWTMSRFNAAVGRMWPPSADRPLSRRSCTSTFSRSPSFCEICRRRLMRVR
jgi:hypothetical protein